MAQILLTEDGKRVQINPRQDVKLYDAPNNPPNTGTAYTRGVDLYAHKARSGQWYFYFFSWSMWQGEGSGYTLASRENAILFLQEKATCTGWAELSKSDMERATEVFKEDVFSEDA